MKAEQREKLCNEKRNILQAQSINYPKSASNSLAVPLPLDPRVLALRLKWRIRLNYILMCVDFQRRTVGVCKLAGRELKLALSSGGQRYNVYT